MITVHRIYSKVHVKVSQVVLILCHLCSCVHLVSLKRDSLNEHSNNCIFRKNYKVISFVPYRGSFMSTHVLLNSLNKSTS